MGFTHELTQQTNSIRNVRSSVIQIDQLPNQSLIKGFVHGCSVFSLPDLDIDVKWGSGRLAPQVSRLLKQIQDVFVLT